MAKSSILLINPLPEESKVDESAMDTEKMEETAKKLPKPTGYKMLIAFPKIEEKYDSGLIKAPTVVQQDQVAAVVGFVIAQGPDCYNDKEKFPTGPWCKEGDFVLLRAYSGSRFMIYGEEFRLINDDAIDGVVLDPRGYSRVH